MPWWTVWQSGRCPAMNASNNVTYQASSWGRGVGVELLRLRLLLEGGEGGVHAPGWRRSFIVGGFHLPLASSETDPTHSPPNLRWSRSWLRKTSRFVAAVVRPRPVSEFSSFRLCSSYRQPPPSLTQDTQTASVATRYKNLVSTT